MTEEENRKFLTVYTVSFSEAGLANNNLAHLTVGSYLSRGDAIRECAKYVIEKIERFGDIRWVFLCGGCSGRSLLESFGADKKSIDDFQYAMTDLMPSVKKKLMDYLVDAIGGDSCFLIELSGRAQYRFDVDENDVESPEGLYLWTCVSSGVDEEDHDPEFENAVPENFLSRQGAIDNALGDLEGFLNGYDENGMGKKAEEIRREMADKLDKEGHFELSLNDMKKVVWDIYGSRMDIGQGVRSRRQGRVNEDGEEAEA